MVLLTWLDDAAMLGGVDLGEAIWIGYREDLQETHGFDHQISGFPVDFPIQFFEERVSIVFNCFMTEIQVSDPWGYPKYPTSWTFLCGTCENQIEVTKSCGSILDGLDASRCAAKKSSWQ